jgi:hypothetical protein
LHALLGLGTHDDLLGHPVVGGSYEGWVIEQLTAQLPQSTVLSYRSKTPTREYAEISPGVDGRIALRILPAIRVQAFQDT